MQKQPLGQRFNDWLSEPSGQQFVAGKWRFWLIAVISLSILNAVLTGLIFKDDTQESYISPIMLSVGALVAWLCIGALHYSDSTDRRLARGVAGLDSVTLLFCVCHFAGLMWAYGHLQTIRSAERKYEAASAIYNAEAKKVSQDGVEIAKAAATIATEQTKRAKIENDTAYQQRKAAEAGTGIPVPHRQSGSAPGAPALTTSQVELERPVKPDETSAHFLGEWDWLIRVFNFGELMLAAVTLVFIRNQSAKTNAPTTTNVQDTDEFPDELDAENRASAKRENFTKKKETERGMPLYNPEGLKRLREALKDISFRLAGFSFKAQVRGDAVWIYLVRANRGTQETAASAKSKLSILNDAMTMDRNKFRERLERFLQENGFEIIETARR
jgi:hypothetical protein